MSGAHLGHGQGGSPFERVHTDGFTSGRDGGGVDLVEGSGRTGRAGPDRMRLRLLDRRQGPRRPLWRCVVGETEELRDGVRRWIEVSPVSQNDECPSRLDEGLEVREFLVGERHVDEPGEEHARSRDDVRREERNRLHRETRVEKDLGGVLHDGTCQEDVLRDGAVAGPATIEGENEALTRRQRAEQGT